MSPLDANDRQSNTSRGTTASNCRRVHIDKLEIQANVGVYPHEHGRLQRLHFWLTLDIIDDYDGRSDRLGDVYDYDDAIAIVRATTKSRHFNLLERLAEEIAEACLADPRVRGVELRIAKPDVVASCRSVGITVVRCRS